MHSMSPSQHGEQASKGDAKYQSSYIELDAWALLVGSKVSNEALDTIRIPNLEALLIKELHEPLVPRVNLGGLTTFCVPAAKQWHDLAPAWHGCMARVQGVLGVRLWAAALAAAMLMVCAALSLSGCTALLRGAAQALVGCANATCLQDLDNPNRTHALRKI